MKKEKLNNYWQMSLLASLTLGLAPFFPEPHIWKQFRLIASGQWTQTLDKLDLLLHGIPWLLLLVFSIMKLLDAIKNNKKRS